MHISEIKCLVFVGFTGYTILALKPRALIRFLIFFSTQINKQIGWKDASPGGQCGVEIKR